MQKIICRFANQQALNQFNKLNNLNLTKEYKEYDFVSKQGKIKRLSKKRGHSEEWKKHWVDMPHYYQPKKEEYAKIVFNTNGDTEQLQEIFNQSITKKTKSIWFPKLEAHTKRYFRVVGGRNGQYPIYVVSKNRYVIQHNLTSKWLNKLETPHYLVVEPSEVALYEKMVKDNDMKFTTVLELDMSYKDNYQTLDDLGDTKGKGPGGARNFCWQHSIKNGFKCHWVMDDNIDCFHYLTNNTKFKVRTGEIFRISEDYFNRFDNVSMLSLNYSCFAKECDCVPAFVKNTRMYSCILIRNDIPFEWRGRYNEDTIISLDALSCEDIEKLPNGNKWSTIQLNVFLADKNTTQKIGGGNTEEFYSKDNGVKGTEEKTNMLVKVYPQYAKKVFKFSREHHYVDYHVFEQELVYKDSYKFVNDYDLKVVKIPMEWEYTLKDTKSYIEEHIDECEIIDYKNR